MKESLWKFISVTCTKAVLPYSPVVSGFHHFPPWEWTCVFYCWIFNIDRSSRHRVYCQMTTTKVDCFAATKFLQNHPLPQKLQQSIVSNVSKILYHNYHLLPAYPGPLDSGLEQPSITTQTTRYVNTCNVIVQ